MSLKILLVDDHIMMTDFYKSVLEYSERIVETISANTLEIAYNFIISKNLKDIDLAILDLSMPPYKIQNINNGQDIAKIIRRIKPEIKIIFISGMFNITVLKELILNIYPEGIIEKRDIDSWDHFLTLFGQILNGEIYKSKSIKKYINEYQLNEINLDYLNLQIIILISKGIKTVQFKNHIPLTLSAINKRKLKIKQYFGIDDGNDEDILREARKIGIL